MTGDISDFQKDRYMYNKSNNKITEHRAIFKRERKNSKVNKQTKSVNNNGPDLVQAFPKKWWVEYHIKVYIFNRLIRDAPSNSLGIKTEYTLRALVRLVNLINCLPYDWMFKTE